MDGKEFTQPLVVKMEPRIKSSVGDLQAQADLESSAVAGMNQSFDALGQVQSVRAQIKEIAPKAKGRVAESLESLDKQCGELVGAPVSTFFGTPPSGRQAENFSSINQHFGQLLGIADSADAAPTMQATKVHEELLEQMNALEQRWTELTANTLPALNKDLQKAGLPTLNPQKPLDHELGGAGDGDDEP